MCSDTVIILILHSFVFFIVIEKEKNFCWWCDSCWGLYECSLCDSWAEASLLHISIIFWLVVPGSVISIRAKCIFIITMWSVSQSSSDGCLNISFLPWADRLSAGYFWLLSASPPPPSVKQMTRLPTPPISRGFTRRWGRCFIKKTNLRYKNSDKVCEGQWSPKN